MGDVHFWLDQHALGRHGCRSIAVRVNWSLVRYWRMQTQAIQFVRELTPAGRSEGGGEKESNPNWARSSVLP